MTEMKLIRLLFGMVVCLLLLLLMNVFGDESNGTYNTIVTDDGLKWHVFVTDDGVAFLGAALSEVYCVDSPTNDSQVCIFDVTK